MYNRLQAIRATILGITFSFFCLFVGNTVYNTLGLFTELTICLGLILLTLCVTWAKLKPSLIYAGFHCTVWFVCMAACGILQSFSPLLISLFISVLLFFLINPIFVLLYNLNRNIFLVGLPHSEPHSLLDGIPPYQQGYRPENAFEQAVHDGNLTLPHPQAQYPEMRL